MDPHWPASSALPPHLRPALGAARLRAHWSGAGLVRALGVREPMPRGLVRRPGGSGDHFLAAFHQPVQVRCADGPRQAAANTLVLWTPGMAQEYGRDDAAWIHSWLHLRGPAAAAMVDAAGLPAGTPIALPGPDAFENALTDLHGELQRAPPDPAIVAALATVLVRRLARLAPAPADGLAEAHRHIVEHPLERPRLDTLAALAGCGPQHLCRAFRKRYGTTPVALAAGVRLERAAQLLDQGLAPQVAAATCGWADVRQFARVFRARFGATPAAWRAR
jgi:AraC-like DNA-binding protein